MERTAISLSISVATLRRRLRDADTSYRRLLDELRRDRANAYVFQSLLRMREVAAELGFANLSAFYKAFARWYPGTTPARARRAAEGFDRVTFANAAIALAEKANGASPAPSMPVDE